MINLSVAEPDNMLRPRLTVVGVGGAGCNAINNMIRSNLEGCDFVVANTDAQALAMSLAPRKLQLGTNLSRGLGAGSKPEIGCAAAEETLPDIMSMLDGSDMLFVTAGMGGGTGTGAAPVIARAARESGILTVGVVTKPFHFEGANRMRQAEGGIAELQKYVDTLIVIPNQNLFRIANERTTFAEAFRMADEVLNSGVRGITDLMVMPGFMNLDFADVKTVMAEMGKAMMGTGEADGDNRALRAAEAAISNPLLDDISMKGARGVLINITGGLGMTLFEVDQAANRIRDEVDPEAQIKVGSTLGDGMDGRIRVSVIATGIDAAEEEKARRTIYTSTDASAPAQRTTRPVQDTRSTTIPVAMKTTPVTASAQAASAAQPAAAPARVTQPVQTTAPQPATTVRESTAAYFTMPTAMAPAAQKVPTASVTMRAPQQPKPVAQPEPVAGTPRQETAQVEEPTYEEEEIEPVVAQTTMQRPTVMAAPPVRELPPVQQAQRQKTAPVGMRTEPSENMRMTQLTTSGNAQATRADSTSGNRRSMGLFQRITGIGIARPSRDDLDEEFDRDVEEAVEASLSVDPADRPVITTSGEPDLLDIPAFLRRQSNH